MLRAASVRLRRPVALSGSCRRRRRSARVRSTRAHARLQRWFRSADATRSREESARDDDDARASAASG